MPEIESFLPLASFLTRADCGIVADKVWLDATDRYFMPEIESLLPLASFLARTCGGSEASNVWLDATVPHVLQRSRAFSYRPPLSHALAAEL